MPDPGRRPAYGRSAIRSAGRRGTSTWPPERRRSPRRGNSSNDCPVLGWRHAGRPTPRPVRTATTPTRSPTSGTRPGATRRCSPRPSATTPTRRSPTCSPCTTGCTTSRTTSASPKRRGTCRRSTSVRTAWATMPSRDGRSPVPHRQPQQRQPGHAARRPAADHEHVPVAAGRRCARTRPASTATTT